MPGSNTSHRPRPLRLAKYIAESAWAIRASAPCSPGPHSATPMLAPTLTSCPAIAYGRCTAAMMRWAMDTA